MRDALDLNKSVVRAPVVAVMGHIDHGKSTLLDFIRKSNVVEGESGGITQHVSAYEVLHIKDDGKIAPITFLDTPGHEAFKGIRSRGASVADIAVLVVSAEDAVKPQTLEAYEKIKSASLPYIVAITKIDKPSANIEAAKQSLAENDIFVEGYGGDIPVVLTSAKTGAGIKDLLDMILLLADLENFVGHPERLGAGVIIESKLDPKKGVTTVGILKDGTAQKGLFAASVGAVAPLRFILDAEGHEKEFLSCSSPIQIVGWDELPPVGANFELFDNKKAAEFYAESEAAKSKKKRDVQKIAEDMPALPLIIKADVSGSLEAIVYEVKKLSRERIVPKIVLEGVGAVGENDVRSALTSPGTIIFAFHTKIDSQAAALAERSGITIESFEVIYKLTERVAELLEAREQKVEVDEVTGTMKILKIFSAVKNKQVLGGRLLSGIIEKDNQVRIMRREVEIGRGHVRELQQNKVDSNRIVEGEFGAMIESKIEIAPGDILEMISRVTK